MDLPEQTLVPTVVRHAVCGVFSLLNLEALLAKAIASMILAPETRCGSTTFCTEVMLMEPLDSEGRLGLGPDERSKAWSFQTSRTEVIRYFIGSYWRNKLKLLHISGIKVGLGFTRRITVSTQLSDPSSSLNEWLGEGMFSKKLSAKSELICWYVGE